VSTEAGAEPANPDETVRSLLVKLRAFAETLDDDERRLFAALIGPGVEQAVEHAEIELFASGVQEFDRLERGLAALARRDQPSSGGATEND
jgi:hypothetical protein